jgi:hypothetical protein
MKLRVNHAATDQTCINPRQKILGLLGSRLNPTRAVMHPIAVEGREMDNDSFARALVWS